MSVATTTRPGRLAARYIRSLAAARGDLQAAASYAAAQRWVQSKEVSDLLQKAATGTLNSTTDPALADPISQDVARLVEPYSVVARLQNFRRVPPRTNVVSQTAGATATWGDAFQSGGKAIAVSASAFSRTQLTERRVSAFSVLTRELALSSSPEADGVISADLGRAIGAAVDAAFLNPYVSGSPADAPASVTASGRIFTASASTIDGIDADLEKLITALSDAGSDLANAVFVLGTLSAARLSRMRGSSGAPAYPGISAKGGTLLGFPCLTTTNIPRSGSPSPGATTVHMIDPSRIWTTDRDVVEISLSTTALVEMDSAPSADSSSGAGANAVSLWQTDSIAIKAVRWLGWQPVAGQSHAATLVGCEW